jgi:hypothetical protein
MAVPGCLGGEEDDSKTDFCVLDPEAQVTGSFTPVAAPAITLATQTVAPTIGIPAELPTFEPTTEVTLAPTEDASNASGVLPELDIVGRNGVPAESYPFGLCQGDCDADEDCQTGLICFLRESNDPVPGCIGEDSSRSDYCIPDPNLTPVFGPTTSPVTSTPSGVPTSSVPTITQTTLAPTTLAQLSDYPSSVPSGAPSSLPTISPMPTTSAEPTATPTGAPTIEPRTGVQLKLYWEEGYDWQFETVERKCEFPTGSNAVNRFAILVLTTILLSFFQGA